MSHCITVYTDASVCSKTKCGGWAAWIKAGPGNTLLANGAFKGEVVNSTDAELRAIANALVVVKKNFETTGAIIVFVTDSQGAIDAIDGVKNGISKNRAKRRRKKGKPELAWEAVCKSIIANIPDGCEARFNKVKAHSRADGKRSYVNNLVDKACRAKMREHRKKITSPLTNQKGNEYA
jgi:ribonuclease HI